MCCRVGLVREAEVKTIESSLHDYQNFSLPSVSICGLLALNPVSYHSGTLSEPRLLGDSQRDYRKLAAGHSSNYHHGQISHTPHLNGN